MADARVTLDRESREERDKLIWQRLDEGVPPTTIARKMGISIDDVNNAKRRREAAAKNIPAPVAEPEEPKPELGLMEYIELLEYRLPKQIKGGMQTHQAQDTVADLMRLVANIKMEAARLLKE